ncbi:MAG TPA: alpha/beta hydrolase [Solirubrobacterales bacterium]|nr:alpha/beta hydrolase [Solirubrobacterales bacterium]
MWEGLARTERQDRVLHGTAKLANVLLGIVLLPLWLFGQLIGGRVRDFLMGLERRGKRPLPVPPERERSMDALMGDLQAIPQHLRHSDFAELRKGFADISNFVVAQHREGAVIGYRYPGQFKDHIVEGADGERIAASIALQEAARPSLIVVHGLFTSSRFDYVRAIAVRAFYEWGFNVAALDLRSFGMTELTSPAPSTGGWKEGLDILALARYMKELGGTSVGALGISLGGSSVLNASDQEDTDRSLDGGILAVSPPAIPKLAWERLSEPVSRGHPRYPIHRAFEAALISRIRSGRWPPEAEDMLRAMEVVSAPYYQVDAEEIWTDARGIDHVPNAKVPLLILHPEDDHIIKVEHARMLQGAAEGNDLVRVWILPAGSHGLLEAADPSWTHAVYRTFFERWGTYAERSTAQANGRGAELVYSSQEETTEWTAKS